MRQIEKPELISTIIEKKKVWLNIRESRLLYMFHRKLISMEEYEAGSRYRLMCGLQGGGTGNVLKERVDGSSIDFDIPTAKYTGHSNSNTESGVFVELPFTATADGTDALVTIIAT